MIQKIKILLLLNLLLVNTALSKELPGLFEVMIPEDQYTNTNDGLNKAFNLLIQKLSGSRSKKLLWKIGDANLKKVEYVAAYSTKLIGDKEFLDVKFNNETLIPELRKIGIPLIGFNRPVILILLKLDTGESVPVFLGNSSSNNALSSKLKQMLKDISLARGVYLELPEFDLEDQNLLSQANILFSPANYIQEKFYNDSFLSIELVRVGINQWSVNGDLESNSTLQEKELIEFFQNTFHNIVDDILEVQPLGPGISGERMMVSIQGLGSFSDFQSVESELDKIFAIKSRTFHSFERSKIDYHTQLFQTKASLIKELRGSTKFLIKEYNADTSQLKTRVFKLAMSKYFIFIPNLLSIIRIYLMYPLLTFISEENYLFALYVFVIAAATDGLDGYLARVMNWQTDLGKILDPIADKVLLIGTILILWMNSYIPLFVLIVFVLRDFIIIMGAAFHMTVYETSAPNPNIFGKFTTFVHIGYLAGVFIDIIFGLNLINFAIDFLVALVTAISLFLYGLNWFKLTAKLHHE